MDCIVHGVAESDMTQSDFHFSGELYHANQNR